jgi:hypothetical protein
MPTARRAFALTARPALAAARAHAACRASAGYAYWYVFTDTSPGAARA